MSVGVGFNIVKKEGTYLYNDMLTINRAFSMYHEVHVYFSQPVVRINYA